MWFAACARCCRIASPLAQPICNSETIFGNRHVCNVRSSRSKDLARRVGRVPIFAARLCCCQLLAALKKKRVVRAMIEADKSAPLAGELRHS
jgi:hypothetical protein